jgi:selenide,water dikinase
LEKALSSLPLERRPELLVGIETADDAGVYQISEEIALVQTVDFITPIVDDPFTFGQIAAVNALSDIYAMGGKPLTALNVVGFPRRSLDLSILTEIIRGGVQKIHEAGAVLLGGHTVDDLELKYGLSVTGTVHPQKVVTNKGAEVGDVLILTKALGVGIISTANKGGMAEPGIFAGAVQSMLELNDKASVAMNEFGGHACTDITGFGLLGHALEMARGCGQSFRFFYSQIPILPGVKELAAGGMVPGGAYCNQEHFGRGIAISPNIPDLEKIVLFDPQTSGGLLIALPRSKGEELLQRLREKGISQASLVGEVLPRGPSFIEVEY